MPRILYSSVCRPFGGPGEGDSVGAELFHAQVTRAQGLFSFRQVIRCWAIDYLAHNVTAPAVVLHYPSEKEFVRELKTQHYDYVGINFVVATHHKVRRMTKLIRKHAPHAQIILGGYGTVLPDELLKPFCDHICREEGIGFMRRLLGESTERPIAHPYAPIPAIRMYSYQSHGVVAHLTAGLGCPNGCDFCCTSHFFKRKYVPFLQTGREIYEAMLLMECQAKEAGDDLRSFILIDEDFFLFKRRAMEFLDCVREGGKTFSIMGFGSVRGLSQFSADEIAEMGFDTIWTAFEGTESGYGKLKGKSPKELAISLRSRGIGLLTSMIIGFPYQNRERVLNEFKQLIRLNPVMTQILIYFAFPGTPFHEQVVAEGRYLPEYQENPDLRRWDGFAMHFKHPNFAPQQVEELQRELYRREFQSLGPSIVRFISTWLEGYRCLRNSPKPLLRARAEGLWERVIEALPALAPAKLFGPTRETRAEACQLFSEILKEGKPLTLKTRSMCWGTYALAAWTSFTRRLGIFQQPALLRIEHRTGTQARPAIPVSRLQGGIHANPLHALSEDLMDKASSIAARLLPRFSRQEDDFSAAAATAAPATQTCKLTQITTEK